MMHRCDNELVTTRFDTAVYLPEISTLSSFEWNRVKNIKYNGSEEKEICFPEMV